MKTSSKIITSFLTFCWVILITALLISFRYSDQRGFSFVKKIEKEEHLLREFKVLVVKNAGVLTITSSDSVKLTYFKIFTDAGESPEEPELSYRLVGDTLYIDRLMQKVSGYFELKVASLKTLVLEDVGLVNFKNFHQDSLQVISNKASSVFQDAKLTFLDYNGISSRLNATTITKLNIRLEDSQAELGGDIESISGWVGDRSLLMLPNKVGKVDLEKSNFGQIQLK